MAFDKRKRRRKIRYRIRKKIKGTPVSPRLSVFKSNKAIYCQAIDDVSGNTLLAASSLEAGIGEKGTKKEQAYAVGKLFAEKALKNDIVHIVFDRSGYLYHGRVKALADGIREGGIKI